MKKLGIFADIHGAWGDGEDVIKKAIAEHGPFDLLVQLGDMGFGFPGVRPWEYQPHCPAKWICGNHENFELLHRRDQPNFGYDPYHVLWPRGWKGFLKRWEYMPRGTIEDGILYIGGASSIDRINRTCGVDWWPEENISFEDEERTLSAIEDYDGPIHTVFSHTCPTSFSMASVLYGPEFATSNRKFLEHVRQLVKPKRWYFGHFHAEKTGTFEGCDWRCINMACSHDYAVLEIP